MAVFGLTSVDMAVSSLGDATDTPTATSALPDIPIATANGTYLTETHPGGFMSPTGAAAAAAALGASSASPGRGAKALAPMPPAPQTPPQSQPLQPQQQQSYSSTQSKTTNPLSSISGSSRRLPPISNSSVATGSGTMTALSPDSERTVQALMTPVSRMVSPKESRVNSDTRNFDGRDLHELVKLSWQDYSDAARVQHMVEVGLSSNTTEASRAEALLQIREASIQNPIFSITPTILGLLRELLHSRNRLLRPAAAYALAGYASNSRYGRGLMTLHAVDLLPRLNTMLRCKVDSLDARYASLAILSTSMHSEHKEAVGRSGSIPLLLNLVRQNIGRSSPAPPAHAEAMGHLIGMYDSSESSTTTTNSLNTYRLDSNDSQVLVNANLTPRKQGLGLSYSYNPSGGNHPMFSGLQAQSYSAPLPGFMPFLPAASGTPFNIHLDHPGLLPFSMDGLFGGGIPLRFGGLETPSSSGDLPSSPSKGAYVLQVKPAAAHAVAALVNLADLPANRQRMREANIASTLEDVMLSRNENVLKERCRLLIDMLQMDTNRFKEAKHGAEMYAVASVGHTVSNFIQRGKDKVTAAAATAAAAAATAASAPGSPGTASGEVRGTSTGATPGVTGGISLKGTLAYNLVRQLERGDQEGDRRAGTVTLKQRTTGGRSIVSRMQSQAMARVQSYARRPPAASTAGIAAAVPPPPALSGDAQGIKAGPAFTNAGSAGLRRASGTSGGSAGGSGSPS